MMCGTASALQSTEKGTGESRGVQFSRGTRCAANKQPRIEMGVVRERSGASRMAVRLLSASGCVAVDGMCPSVLVASERHRRQSPVLPVSCLQS